ncbi:hypothetical protein FF125_12000 [Aureibaculum algae]|uniref:Polysaccharide deacetylase n=1 Tax=Aureibaculum algae TaxID=2584122 RepID=A0A5B7TWR7_9FLAO|nr:hypothetical protein [Aureibaculum algae]QCX39122.1 hypothetical protein FF125_12000 [Aureibaculum algae]
MDFTVRKYKELLQALIKKGYTFQTFEEFIKSPSVKSIVLRHDVDLLPHNSLKFAEIQAENGVKGVYYFRAVPESWDESVIKKIADLGHEIGYHYECLTTCKGDMKKGMSDFEKNLADLRKLAPVSTICMHGSPASKYDSKDLWKENNYRDYEIIGEPYFDVDFKDVFYMTDTGRMWDGHKVSVRDRVNSSYKITFHSTNDIIEYLISHDLPNRMMFTFHPQRWNDGMLNWTKEYIMQHIKNIIKKAFYVNRK